ncbi:hypothetical protein BJY01DRAFT_248088 [Aspergillus pseudoustus]|uniref:Aminoglycoside phosphotransferase domain-containing protein n=1 Tax=Aspergillus pseudoustus TaxID=1810923 RepID=A0ABR4JX15_9EURO
MSQSTRPKFTGLISTIQRGQVSKLAYNFLKKYMPYDPTVKTGTLPTVGDPLYGSNNVVFPITFASGLRWALKMPLTGTRAQWTRIATSALEGDVSTMHFLHHTTAIPVPGIIGYDVGFDNRVGCPHVMMEFVDGVPLHEVWFDRTGGAEAVHARRTRMLQGIASAMVQLGRYSFPAAGSLVKRLSGSVEAAGERFRAPDHEGLGDIVYAEHSRRDADNPKAWYTKFMDTEQQQQESAGKIKKRKKDDDDDGFSNGVESILRQLVAWVPEPARVAPFVLTHPDFAMRNFFVSREGELMGIIGWEGTTSAPRSRGNEQLPSWLTDDWTLHMQEKQAFRAAGDTTLVFDETGDLRYYRRIYCELIEKCKAEQDEGIETTKQNDFNVCQMSPITEAIMFAVDYSHCRHAIVEHLVAELWKASELNKPPAFEELVRIFAKKNVDPKVKETLHLGFLTLLKNCR